MLLNDLGFWKTARKTDLALWHKCNDNRWEGQKLWLTASISPLQRLLPALISSVLVYHGGFLDIIWLPLITSSTCRVSPWWFKPLWHFSRLCPCSQTAGDLPFCSPSQPSSLTIRSSRPPSFQLLCALSSASSICFAFFPPFLSSLSRSLSLSLFLDLFLYSHTLSSISPSLPPSLPPHQLTPAPSSPQESPEFGLAPCLCVWTVCAVLGSCH